MLERKFKIQVTHQGVPRGRAKHSEYALSAGEAIRYRAYASRQARPRLGPRRKMGSPRADPRKFSPIASPFSSPSPLSSCRPPPLAAAAAGDSDAAMLLLSSNDNYATAQLQ